MTFIILSENLSKKFPAILSRYLCLDKIARHVFDKLSVDGFAARLPNSEKMYLHEDYPCARLTHMFHALDDILANNAWKKAV